MANDGPFLYYSALHGRPVLDPDSNVVGRLDDLAVTLTETFRRPRRSSSAAGASSPSG